MDTAVFYEVVVPLLELDATALICISTILDSFNFYSKLMELKDENGEPFFVTHTFVMACPACQDAGIPETCTHMFHELPPWQSARKHKKIRAMMSDQKELLQRETMGIQSDAFGQAFKNKSLRALRERELFSGGGGAPRHLFMSIDPSGGGASHFALVTCFYSRGAVVVRIIVLSNRPPVPTLRNKRLNRVVIFEHSVDGGIHGSKEHVQLGLVFLWTKVILKRLFPKKRHEEEESEVQRVAQEPETVDFSLERGVKGFEHVDNAPMRGVQILPLQYAF